MFIFLAVEITGMAFIDSLVAGIPLWATALIVMAVTLAYTTYGGSGPPSLQTWCSLC